MTNEACGSGEKEGVVEEHDTLVRLAGAVKSLYEILHGERAGNTTIARVLLDNPGGLSVGKMEASLALASAYRVVGVYDYAIAMVGVWEGYEYMIVTGDENVVLTADEAKKFSRVVEALTDDDE